MFVLGSIQVEVDPWQIGLIVGGVITVILALLGALMWSSRSNSKNSQTTISIFDTLVQLNKELAAASEERLKHAVERERWEASRHDLTRRVNEQAEDIEKNKRLAKDASELHTQALGKLQEKLQTALDCQTTLETRINDLTHAVRQKDEQISALTLRIDELEKENRDLKGERELLISQVAEVQRERDDQKRQLDDLRAKLEALEKRESGGLTGGLTEGLHSPEAAEASELVTEGTAAPAAGEHTSQEGEQVS